MSYVTKLPCRRRTYGTITSQGTSQSQNPLASTQHPLLLPTVLDTIFPYLSFNDLKNCRFVCSTWSAVGIPLIARKKLNFVDFSAINFADFLALKSEFLKFPSKVNFFQGFRLGWTEINTMVWTNFLAAFKPKSLVISGKDMTDPWTNFDNLLQPVLTTLTHLCLKVSWDALHSCPAFTFHLNNLANLQPLTLKSLCLKMGRRINIRNENYTAEQIYDLKLALEKLLQSQSRTLEDLELYFIWNVLKKSRNFKVKTFQIHLPIFSRLRSMNLDLQMYGKGYLSIFAQFDFNLKFPQLVQMKLGEILIDEMKEGAFDLTRGHPLKKLELSLVDCSAFEFGEYFPALYSSFPHIEELSSLMYSINLEDGGIEVPWVDSLRILHASGSRQDFDFRHLKKLECLHYEVCPDEEDIELPIGSLIKVLSDHHHQLPHLKSFHLSYKDMTQEKMNEIREGVPAEFRNIFIIDNYRLDLNT